MWKKTLIIKHSAAAAAAAKSLQLCPTLCDPIEGSPPGSPVPGILQARTEEWVAISSSNAWKWKVKAKSLSHVGLLATPWTAAHQAPPIHGIFQARVLEWVAIAFSKKNIYFCFIDYAKAFDCVDHNKLWKILKEMGIKSGVFCLQVNTSWASLHSDSETVLLKKV